MKVPILMWAFYLVRLLSTFNAVFRLANKSDKPEALPVNEIQAAFRKTTSGRLVGVFKTQLTCEDLSVSGLPQAFDWLNTAFEIVKASESTGQSIAVLNEAAATASSEKVAPTPTLDTPRAPNMLAQKLESWLVRSENLLLK